MARSVPGKPHLRVVDDRSTGVSVPGPREPQDLEQCFRRYAPYVARIGLRMLGRHDEVDDLVQDVFLAAHAGLEHLRSPGAITGWLATVTVRLAGRRLRRRRMWRALGIGRDYDYASLATRCGQPEDQLLVARVYARLDDLPSAERVAWTLRVVEGEKLEHVALICACSLATVKRRVAAAQQALQEVLGD